jgi:hypothetical protein
MASMLELVRESAVPANVMRSAARGTLALPSGEMLEILVHLANTKLWGERAQLTLAAWNERELQKLLCAPAAPTAVLRYFCEPANLRPALLPALLENPQVPLGIIMRLADYVSLSTIEIMLQSPRVQQSAAVLHALARNPCVSMAASTQIAQLLPNAASEAAVEDDPYSAPAVEKSEFELRFAQEIAAAEGMAFSLTDASEEERTELARKHHDEPVPGVRLSVLQKIAQLNVGERIQLALRGSRDERFILIRDASRVVALAVLESPKVTESEMEAFASMRNVHEDVLRSMARIRRYMKHYSVVRALANNPKTPLETAAQMLSHLVVNDLRRLVQNKNVGEMVRKIALKMFRAKTEKGRNAE